MKRILGAVLAAAIAGLCQPARAIDLNVVVLASCGTVPLTLPAGTGYSIFTDQNGSLCTSGSGGGGGGDASAGNQTLQITQETAINTVLGTQASGTWDGSAAAALMSISRYQGVKLEAIRALLAAPIAVTGTFFQATQPVSLASVPSHAVTNAGTFAVQAAQSGTWTEANSAAILTAAQAALPSGTNTIGSVGIVPQTSGGLTTSSTIITTANGVLNVKASAGQVYKIEVSNNQATAVWLKLYNSASAPTAGSGTPVRRILIPGNSSGVVFSASYEAGLAFSTGIGYALTGLIADNDTTAVTASVIVVNIDYK